MSERRRLRVYVAGPYSKPDPCANTNAAMRAWLDLWLLGFAPYCPHWTHFQHTFTPLPYGEWLEYDECWVPCCEAVLRLPGESSGADREVAQAVRLGIPVYHSIQELVADAGRLGVGG